MAEADDAFELRRLYDSSKPRSAVLDRRREITYPTVDELREGLARPDKPGGPLYAIEDRTGSIHGFCALRGASPELAYGEIILPLFEEADYETPLADEALGYLCRMAFAEKRLNKVISHCLDDETGYRTLLARRGFESNGIQREVVWAGGRYRDLETLSLFSDKRAPAGNGKSAAE
jgi:RimJ/RimL family protein N-acetyltransferase